MLQPPVNKFVFQAIVACTAGILLLSGAQAADLMPLGDLPGGDFRSRAHGVSADGSVVVGWGSSASGQTAFVWTQGDGIQSLHDVLMINGATGLGGWQLQSAHGISADGQWVVGHGINPSGDREAFLASLDLSAVDTDKVPIAIFIILGEDEN